MTTNELILRFAASMPHTVNKARLGNPAAVARLYRAASQDGALAPDVRAACAAKSEGR